LAIPCGSGLPENVVEAKFITPFTSYS